MKMINYFREGFTEEKQKGKVFRFSETEEIDFVAEMKKALAKMVNEIKHSLDCEEPFTSSDLVSSDGQKKMNYCAREIMPYFCNGDNMRVLNCLRLTAQLRPILISSLNIHHYNIVVITLVMGQEYWVIDGLADLIHASECYTYGNLIDERLAQICWYGVDNEDFCGWIIGHWEQCQYQKQHIKNFMKKADTGKYKTLYRLVNPSFFSW